MPKRALITGITGQDGQHLAELLQAEGYEVFGMVKGQNNPRIAGVLEEFSPIEAVSGGLPDLSSLVETVEAAYECRCSRHTARAALVRSDRYFGQKIGRLAPCYLKFKRVAIRSDRRAAAANLMILPDLG